MQEQVTVIRSCRCYFRQNIIKLFVTAVEKTTAGRLQQLQRGGRLVGLRYRKVSLKLSIPCKQSLPNSLCSSLLQSCSVFPLREGLSLFHCNNYLWSACFKRDSSIGGGTFDPLDAGGNFRYKLSRHISRRGFGSALNMPKCFLFGLYLSIENGRDLYSQLPWRVYFFLLSNYLNKYFDFHVKMKTSGVVSWLHLIFNIDELNHCDLNNFFVLYILLKMHLTFTNCLIYY